MSFKNLTTLNTLVTNAFLMRELVSLFENEGYNLKEKDVRLLNNALKYISLIKSGEIYLSIMRGEEKFNSKEDLPVDSLRMSLEAYNTTFKALMRYEKPLSIKRFNEIIIMSEKQVEETVSENKITRERLDEAFGLFNSVRAILLEKANKLSNEKKVIFKVH